MITTSVMKGLRKKLVFSLLTVLSVLDLFLLQILKFSVSPVLQASCLSSNYCYILHYLYYYINFFLHMIIRINFSVWLITRHKTLVKLALIIQLIEYHPICSYKNNICLRKYFWKQPLLPSFYNFVYRDEEITFAWMSNISATFSGHLFLSLLLHEINTISSQWKVFWKTDISKFAIKIF